MNATTCRACGECFDACSEESANAPNRLCRECWKRGVRLDCFGNRLPGSAAPIILPPGLRRGEDPLT